jgi:hypothetical protein
VLRIRTPILAGVFAVTLAYAASPYVTLGRLGFAVRNGDAAALAHMVDWHAVREGIKEDICDSVLDMPARPVSAGQLPAFGASFMRGVAGGRVDQGVTPETLASQRAGAPSPFTGGRLGWSFFESLSRFTASFTAPGAGPIRLQLELRQGAWQVTRVWLPVELLDGSADRT